MARGPSILRCGPPSHTETGPRTAREETRMEFTNTFEVNAPLEQVWAVLLQPEEITPCVPGATLTEKVDDTHYRGTVKVKLGAVQMSYRGELEMEPDEA